MHAVAVRRAQLERAHAFDGDLAALPLDVRQGRKTGVQCERSAVVRALEADQELMTACRGIADRQHDGAIPLAARIAGLERAPRDARQLVAGWQLNGNRAGLTLHHRHVDECHHPHVRVAERHQRHDFRKHAHVASRCRRRTVAHRPPHLGRGARRERRLHHRAPVDSRLASDEARGEVNAGLLTGQIDRDPRRSRRRNREDERRASRGERQRGAPLECQRKRTGSRQQGRMRGAFDQQRERPARRAGVDKRRSRQQAHAVETRSQHLSRQVEHPACGLALDADTEIGAGEDRRHRRDRGALRRPAREIDQAIVFGE